LKLELLFADRLSRSGQLTNLNRPCPWENPASLEGKQHNPETPKF